MIEVGSIRLFSAAEIANNLGFSMATMKRYLRDGKIRGRKVGGRVYITEENLKEFLAGNRNEEPVEFRV